MSETPGQYNVERLPQDDKFSIESARSHAEVKKQLEGMRSRATKKAAKRAGRTSAVEIEFKNQKLRQTSAYLNETIEMLEEGKLDTEPGRSARLAVCQLLAMGGFIDGICLVIDCLSYREPCHIRPYLGTCTKCGVWRVAKRTREGYVCSECGGTLTNLRKSRKKEDLKKGFKRISLMEAVLEMSDLIGGDGDDPGLLGISLRQMYMLNDIGIGQGAFSRAGLPVHDKYIPISDDPFGEDVENDAENDNDKKENIGEDAAIDVVDDDEDVANIEDIEEALSEGKH